ncbi:hypothetical protein AVEN_60233-1 [Araneus ventricosus]|uniref:Uncharacterized protein n=1 Tax=Araneus ventricosus TaxID=182803 RepID=A0A4Y2CM98_ARAVE|nr:hypothetical protein AVEN_60233-1 [Araneus ventricosus]
MEVDAEEIEKHLVTYLENILKCQIIPMNYMNLRNLVEDAPQNLKLYDYIEEKYPDAQFLDFLRKYPQIFTLNPNRTVILTQGNSFTLPYMTSSHTSDTNHDEVDAHDKGEYISNSESSDSEDEPQNERSRLIQVENSSGRPSSHPLDDSDSSSSCSDSSVDVFSSEIVQTSDSVASSLSSNSEE